MIISIDTETTGFNAYGNAAYPDLIKDEILQLAIVGEYEKGNVTYLYNEYFRPSERRLEQGWEKAAAVNGITPESTLDKKPISSYKEKIQSILDAADIIVGYNVYFDVSFLEAAGFIINHEKLFDVMLAFAPIYGEWNTKRGTYKWQKLSCCAEYYNYEWDEAAHNALGDCKATLFCYHRILESTEPEV